MSPLTETALPKSGTGGREDRNGTPVPRPDLEEMRRPKRYVNGRPVVAAPPVEQVQDEFSAIEVDATARLVELGEMRQRLAPEALTNDSGAEAELQNVLAEIRAAEGALENVALARRERARRAAEAREQAGAEARTQALAEAERLEPDLERALRAADSGARKYACALADIGRISAARQRALTAAGRRGGAPPSSSSIERGLAKALADAGVPRGMIDLPPPSGPPALLAELAGVPVAPAEEAKERD